LGASPYPPKSTQLPATESYAMAAANLASGPEAAICVHAVPSHSHTSESTFDDASNPPKSTTRFRATSYAIECPPRAEGPVVAISVHAAPSHRHVSPMQVESSSWVLPPKSRTPADPIDAMA